jgi:hypothetical protein
MINMAGLLSALLMNPRKRADDGKYLWNVHPTRFRKRYLVSVPVIFRLECEFYLCARVWIVWIVYPRGTAKAYAKGRDRARNGATSKRKPHALCFLLLSHGQSKFSSNNPPPHIYPSYVPTLAYFTDFLTCCQIGSSKAKTYNHASFASLSLFLFASHYRLTLCYCSLIWHSQTLPLAINKEPRSLSSCSKEGTAGDQNKYLVPGGRSK